MDILTYVLSEAKTFVEVPIQAITDNFSRFNVAPDGNCFYTASWLSAVVAHNRYYEEDDHNSRDIVLAISEASQLRGAQWLRRRVGDRIAQSTRRRRNLIEAGIDPDEYAQGVYGGEWADEPEILAASRELQCPIVIFERIPQRKHLALAWVGGAEESGSPPIVLWRKNEHYDALLMII